MRDEKYSVREQESHEPLCYNSSVQLSPAGLRLRSSPRVISVLACGGRQKPAFPRLGTTHMTIWPRARRLWAAMTTFIDSGPLCRMEKVGGTGQDVISDLVAK